MRYELRPTSESDKEAIRRLNNLCYREVVEVQFGEWDDDLQRTLFEEKWELSHYQKIMCSGRMAGVLAIAVQSDHLFLSEIQIGLDFQGEGLGTAVMTDILSDSAGKNLPVRLQVLLKNRAKTLYERLGFVVTGETDTYSRDEPKEVIRAKIQGAIVDKKPYVRILR